MSELLIYCLFGLEIKEFKVSEVIGVEEISVFKVSRKSLICSNFFYNVMIKNKR